MSKLGSDGHCASQQWALCQHNAHQQISGVQVHAHTNSRKGPRIQVCKYYELEDVKEETQDHVSVEDSHKVFHTPKPSVLNRKCRGHGVNADVHQHLCCQQAAPLLHCFLYINFLTTFLVQAQNKVF